MAADVAFWLPPLEILLLPSIGVHSLDVLNTCLTAARTSQILNILSRNYQVCLCSTVLFRLLETLFFFRRCPAQALSSFHGVEVPSTVHDAEQLFHLVQAHRNTCELKKTVAVQRLHTALLYVQGLRKEVETADHTLSAANEDLGRVRAIRETGLSVKYGLDSDDPCNICRGDSDSD
ncbi:hypothetical protein B0H13DRAFT_2276925 [Mycena leptocephala]|nr:hypothetical protein B0H13DRAFT_2276925 [Mycena leptocephala]